MKGKTSFWCCHLITFWNLFLASSGIVNVYKRVQKNDHFFEIFVVFIDFWSLILASSGIVNTYKRIQKWSLCHVLEYFWTLILASSGIINMYKRSKSCSFPRFERHWRLHDRSFGPPLPCGCNLVIRVFNRETYRLKIIGTKSIGAPVLEYNVEHSEQIDSIACVDLPLKTLRLASKK